MRVERAEIIRMVAGLGLPVIAAPVVALVLRRFFALFYAEGVDLLGNITIEKKDARALGALMAKLNVVVLLVAWLSLFTCHCFGQSAWLLAAIALAGITIAVVITTLLVHTNVRRLKARTVVFVGLLVFAGGNLPLIVVTAALMALL
jgi:hypothetical protein